MFLPVVEVIAAVLPRKVGCEGGEEVVDRPRDDHVVVESNEALGHKVGKPEAFEHGGEFGVEGDGAKGGVLA